MIPSPARRPLTRREALAAGAAAVAASAFPATAAAKARPRRVDVAIVGAGLAGLSAARDLRRKGAKVVVLEGRDRVGGRTLNASIGGGEIVEAGGQWVGPTQTRMLQLTKDLGLQTFKMYDEGQYVFEYQGVRSLFRGLLPPIPQADLTEFATKLVELEGLAKGVPAGDPLRAKNARALDAQTVEQWKIANLKTPGARFLIDLVAESVFSAEPADLSFLHFLFYASAAGKGKGDGFTQLTSTAGGAQELRWVGGSQRVSLELAERLAGAVRLNSAVRRIAQDRRGATITTSRGSFRADRVIVAMSPLMAGRIATNDLPGRRRALHRGMPNGRVIKCNVVYDRPFWRDEGLAGYTNSDRGPVKLTYDNSPPDGSPGVLLAFIEGAEATTWAARPAAARRAAVLEALTRYYGPKAAQPVGYVEKDWTADPYTRGCYAGYFGPKGWTDLGAALRTPTGVVHWAGTETATEWMGYMEGAVQSGRRAAAEVARRL